MKNFVFFLFLLASIVLFGNKTYSLNQNNTIVTILSDTLGRVVIETDSAGAHILSLSTDQGTTWQRIDYGHADIMNGCGDLFGIYADGLYTGGGIVRSTDFGKTWMDILTGSYGFRIEGIGVRQDCDLFTQTHDAFDGIWEILHSTDNGTSWLQTASIEADTYNLFSFNDSGHVFCASTLSGNILRSTNNGNTWNKFNTQLGYEGIKCFPNGLGDLLLLGGIHGVFRSVDKGQTWITSGLPNDTINAICIIAPNLAFSGTASNGIFKSTDNGSTWFAANLGLPTDEILAIRNTPDGTVLIGTRNNGLFRSTNSGIDWHSVTITSIDENETESPVSFTLEQNYPNPFNPNTFIEFSIPVQQIVKLNIYDMLGNQVAEMLNENKSAGDYKIEFDASNLSSGVYFYQLKTNSKILTNKMVLLK